MEKNLKKEPISMVSNVSLNINDEDHAFIYCWNEFRKYPNTLKTFISYNKNEFNKIIDDNNYCLDAIVTTEIIPADEFDIVNEKYLIKISETIYISYYILDVDSDDATVQDLTFYFKSQEDDAEIITKIVDEISETIVVYDETSVINNLNVVTLSANGLDVEPIRTPEIDENIELFYNSKTFKSVKKLAKTIKNSDKGLSILYGEKGTGKTSIINYIAEKTGKFVIYIPNTLLDSTLNNPEFRNFLRRYDKPIIVLDDCEVNFNNVFAKTNIYVNNLLQLIDGYLANDVNIITIFNSNLDEVDTNLLNSNSLHESLEFEFLNVGDANELSKHLNKKKKHKTNVRLIDIIRNNDSTKTTKIGLE